MGEAVSFGPSRGKTQWPTPDQMAKNIEKTIKSMLIDVKALEKSNTEFGIDGRYAWSEGLRNLAVAMYKLDMDNDEVTEMAGILKAPYASPKLSHIRKVLENELKAIGRDRDFPEQWEKAKKIVAKYSK